jgi:hypothetical protein
MAIRLTPFGESHLPAFAELLTDFPRTWLSRYEAGRRDGTSERSPSSTRPANSSAWRWRSGSSRTPGPGSSGTILVARCEIAYHGRATARLGAGDRVILFKDDGSLCVHAQKGYKPLNSNLIKARR